MVRSMDCRVVYRCSGCVGVIGRLHRGSPAARVRATETVFRVHMISRLPCVRDAVSACALFGALAVCAGPLDAQTGAPGGDGRGAGAFLAEYYADVITEMGEAMTEWRAAWRADDLEETVNSYWEEAQVLFPERPPIIGHSAITAFYAELLPKVGEVQTSMIDFDASGRMAFVSGPFFYEVPSRNGSPDRIEGTHVTVLLRKGRDWRIRSQIFRFNVVETPPPAR